MAPGFSHYDVRKPRAFIKNGSLNFLLLRVNLRKWEFDLRKWEFVLLRTFAPKSSHVQIFLKLRLQVKNYKIRLKT